MHKRQVMWRWLLGLPLVAILSMAGASVLAYQARPPKVAIDTRNLPEVSAHPVPRGAIAPVQGHQPGRIFLVRGAQGWMAFANRSTHLGEPVEWRAEYNRFLDIYSGAMWDKEGRPVAGPAPRGLDGYAVTQDGDFAVIDFAKPVIGQH
ncbi:MAG TPA: hypothetical protein VK464_20875 [Symbiobacteriaceae bacterium]|nr:hypothetical protein [Symbiobacteriaceae bacterium]